MFNRKIFLLIACLMVVMSSGCVTTKTTYATVEPDSMQGLIAGQEVTITTNKAISINEDKEVYSLRMTVTDVNPERIQGNYIPYDDKDMYLSGSAVEVKVEDISGISLIEEELVASDSTKDQWRATKSTLKGWGETWLFILVGFLIFG